VRIASLALLFVVLVACAAPARSGPPTAATDLLFVSSGAGLRALDPSTGRLGFAAHGAVPTADWSRLVATVADGRGSRLTVLDGKSGAEQASFRLDAPLAVGVVSASGRRAALIEPRDDGAAGPYAPRARARTHIEVIDLIDGTRRSYDLAGNFEPEAFSSDDNRLFVLEYLPASAPDRYRVRQLHLGSRQFVPMIDRWKKFPVPFEEEMRGIGRTQLLSHDRRTLYTLYVHQPDHLHGRELARIANGQPVVRDDVHAFVHVLDLAEGSAFCVDLPAPFGAAAAAGHAMALSPDGKRLYVVEPASDLAAVVDTVRLAAGAASAIGLHAEERAGVPALAATPSGALYLATGSGLARLDPASAAVARRWRLAAGPEGLAVSPDGRRLYASVSGGVAVLDAESGEQVAEIGQSVGVVRQAVLAR
jgi:hypothetical protein